jgi:hypothetical protein
MPAYKIVFELWQQSENIVTINFNWPIRHGSDYVSLKEINMVQIMSASKKLVDQTMRAWLFREHAFTISTNRCKNEMIKERTCPGFCSSVATESN